ncbi:VOC family protein [Haloferula chungangensis]|uniref:VOC family protein n=1 Tax=Haloferula chungangensis TaxID=1048331 RepID=A0ABW2L8Y3_9BACT
MKLKSQNIVPHLWFGKNAIEAARFYCTVFPDSEVTGTTTLKDTPGGDCDVVLFQLSGQPFMALGTNDPPAFNESVSLMIHCENQEEVDHYYDKLSADPEFEQCGWIKDKYGVTWQIATAEIRMMFETGSPEQIRSFAEAIWKMHRIDLKTLNDAFTETSK